MTKHMLTREENIFIAKKYLAENIFSSARIEGCDITFPEIKAILNGAIINDVAASDVQIVFNLRDAWRLILTTLNEPLTMEYACKVNYEVTRNQSLAPGVLRNGHVGISGTEYVPKIPTEESAKQWMDSINEITDSTERAIAYFCQGTKAQLFWDGNKRTSTIIANKILIESGNGLLTIGFNEEIAFSKALTHYYDTDDKQPLETVLGRCVHTIEWRQQKNKP